MFMYRSAAFRRRFPQRFSHVSLEGKKAWGICDILCLTAYKGKTDAKFDSRGYSDARRSAV